jgi:hypothetical protein
VDRPNGVIHRPLAAEYANCHRARIGAPDGYSAPQS